MPRQRNQPPTQPQGPFTRGPLARRSTIPAFEQPHRRDSPVRDAATHPPGHHPQTSTDPVARLRSQAMAQSVSAPIPLPSPVSASTGFGSLAPPVYVSPKTNKSDSLDVEMTASSPSPKVALLQPIFSNRSPGQIDATAASARATAEAAVQRTNRFHRSHRFNRLPLTPRSRSPITFAFSGEPSEYFALWRGRRVRLPGPLPWPCDNLELERVEAQHWLTRVSHRNHTRGRYAHGIDRSMLMAVMGSSYSDTHSSDQ